MAQLFALIHGKRQSGTHTASLSIRTGTGHGRSPRAHLQKRAFRFSSMGTKLPMVANPGSAHCPAPLKFIAGSMFICRAELLTNFRDTLANVEFEIPSREHPSTLSHAAERLLGHSVTASGFAIRDVYSPGSAKLLFRIKTLSQYALFAIRRFLYQKKSTRKGTTIIKICKIPVFFSHK